MARVGELELWLGLKSTIEKDLKGVRQSLKGIIDIPKAMARDTGDAFRNLGAEARLLFKDWTSGAISAREATKGLGIILKDFVLTLGMVGAIIGAATTAIVLIRKAIQAVVPATREFGLAMGGLESVAIRFGHSAGKATEAAMRLSEDGLINPRTAAEGLKRLLITGLGLPEATKMMKAYIDMAAFGRSTSLDMNQAILNLAQSFVTERSMLADNSGMYENYKEIVAAGAKALGKKTDQLNYSERRLAKYTGTLMVATRAEGDAKRLSETYAGTMAKLSNAMYMLKVVVGSLVIPVLSRLAGWFTVVLRAASTLIARIAPGWLQMGMDMAKGSAVGVGAISDLRKQFDELGGKASDTAKKIKRAMEDFAHSTKNALRDFKRQLADLVFAHRDKVADLKKQLDEERRNLQERIDKMREPYEELKKNAIQAGKERLANLKAQLDKELAKGKNTNWEKVRMLQDFIAEEKIAIDKSIKEWDAKAKAEIDIEVAKRQARIDSIKKELQEEEAILRRHAELIATIKTLQREDDIAQLIRMEVEKRAELERQHQKTLEGIKEAGVVEGAAMGEAFGDTLLEEVEKTGAKLREGIINALKDVKIDWPTIAKGIFVGLGAALVIVAGLGIGSVILGLKTTIAAAFIAVFAGISIGTIIGNWIKTGEGEIAAAISVALLGVMGLAITSSLLGLGTTIATAFAAAFAGVGLGIIIGNWFLKNKESIIETGRNIANSIVDGIGRVTDNLIWAGKHIMNMVIQGAKEFAGGALQLGMNIANGIIEGIKSITGTLIWAGKHIMNSIITGITSFLSWALTLPGMLVTGISEGLKDILKGIKLFQKGGVVPGRIGEPQLAVVHGGERIIPADKRGGEVIQTFHVTVQSPWDFQLMMERAALVARRGIR